MTNRYYEANKHTNDLYEAKVTRIITDYFKGSVEATKNDCPKMDTDFHTDVIIKDNKGNFFSIDIKMQKKIRRYDEKPATDVTWVELFNRRGDTGWCVPQNKNITRLGWKVDMENDCVCQECEDMYLIVPRWRLHYATLKMIIGKQLQNMGANPVCYQPYHASDGKGGWHKDVIVLMPVHILRTLATYEIKK